jgi:hypothetical protein
MRAINDRYHAFGERRRTRLYLTEAQYRVSRPFDLAAVRSRLLQAVLTREPCPTPMLRPANNVRRYCHARRLVTHHTDSPLD